MCNYILHDSQVGVDTMFTDLHNTLEYSGDGFHMLSQGLREEVERISRSDHQWDSYNVDQLVILLCCFVLMLYS